MLFPCSACQSYLTKKDCGPIYITHTMDLHKCLSVCRQIAGLQALTSVLMDLSFHKSKPEGSLSSRACHMSKARGHSKLNSQPIYTPTATSLLMELQGSKLCIYPGVMLRCAYRTTTSTESTFTLLNVARLLSHSRTIPKLIHLSLFNSISSMNIPGGLNTIQLVSLFPSHVMQRNDISVNRMKNTG